MMMISGGPHDGGDDGLYVGVITGGGNAGGIVDDGVGATVARVVRRQHLHVLHVHIHRHRRVNR